MVFRALVDPVKYGFGVGRVKVLETKLLAAQRLERLIEAEDFAQAIYILAETEYGSVFEGANTPSDIEKALNEYLGKVYGFIEEVSAGERWTSFFLTRYDMHNLKVLLKAALTDESLNEMLFPIGKLDVESAKEAIAQDKMERLPYPYAQIAKQVKESYEQTGNAQLIDMIIDREMYLQLSRLAREEKRKFLQEFVSMSIDIANLKILFRSKLLKKSDKFLGESLIEGGFIKRKMLLSLFAESWDAIINRLTVTRYASLFAEGWREAIAGETLNHFDTIADNFLLDYARRAKRISIGPEPIFGYMLAKENEIKIIRIILIGKLAGLSKEVIRERMRSLYV